jgi:hypothetical protein
MKHDGESPVIEEDLLLFDRLVGSEPLHASPTEHQAMSVSDSTVQSGNLRGWIQFRKIVEQRFS